MKDYLVLAGSTIHSEQGILHNHAIVIKNQCIDAIVSNDAIKQYSSAKVLHFPAEFNLVPGFIDMHIHGVNGKDVMDANFNSLAEMGRMLAKEGTTAYLATTMTAPAQTIENVLCHVRDFTLQQEAINGAVILGVHLEGPFISPDKIGAQSLNFIHDPDIRLIERWQKASKNTIKLVTLAPELMGSHELIRYLKRNHILASIGHTHASYSQTIEAITAGCSHATHLFNAMRGIHQREPGAVTAVLLSDAVTAELIVDGVHLHPAIVQLAMKIKGVEKLVLVTDAMRAKCLSDGVYDLGGQTVNVKNGIATLSDGTLAGSTLKMCDAVKNMLQWSGCGLSDVIKMASENPAKSLGIFEHKGSIAVGKDADLVMLNEQHDVVVTVCRGRIVSA